MYQHINIDIKINNMIPNYKSTSKLYKIIRHFIRDSK